MHAVASDILSGGLFATVSLAFSCGVPMPLPNIFCKIVYDARLAGNRTKHRTGINALSSGTEYFASVRTFHHNSVQLSFDYIDFRGAVFSIGVQMRAREITKNTSVRGRKSREQLNEIHYLNQIIIRINSFAAYVSRDS